MSVTSGRPLRPTAKALPGHSRGHNRALVLQSLYREGPQSRADLARATSLTPVTIGALVTDLMAEGLAVELGTRTASRVGKPATLVGFDPQAAHIVSIDLSADKQLRGARLDLNGTVLTTTTLARRNRTGEAAYELVEQLARELVETSERPVLGVGVGSPGVVDHEGSVLDAPNLGWKNQALAQRLGENLDHPVHVVNDADAAALAEHSFGAAGSNALVVTVGHGVGAGVLVNGSLLRGERFAAGEIGHVTVEERGAQCACGRIGCLETILAEPQLRERAAKEGARALRRAGRSLGVTLAPVVSTLDLGEIVLNGPPDLLGGPLLEALESTVRKRVMPVTAGALVVRQSSLHEHSVLLGASVLVLSGELGVS
jgi:predicted NBD/HSP70 family sugar kinase